MVKPHPVVAAAARKGSLARAACAVLWAFFGVRRRADYEADAAQLNPVHVVAMAIAVAAAFVATLLAIVHWIVG
ncbi:MAG: DUF2970 domain-containing protein [Sutterellaceae bacterium]|nr:DUF2970 domain-containing protein [Burkholderiaceae bacterium]MCX7901273.1 DUF2970 domain-containing protein [Burkholderiaceae bacterium]MDW8429423.1 DUF2970 domain-containing protein [Sutterellaceae bacterium]